MQDDTISAISTGAIGLVRITGENAFPVSRAIFRPKNPDFFRSAVGAGSPASAHTIHYGHIVDPSDHNSIIDEVMLAVMKAPNTYTKEDTIEISCHNNPVILQKILEAAIKSGARVSEPGEFTKRAFLNGRIDLCQAEAVAELINAKTIAATKTALSHIKGNLSICISSVQASIIKMLTEMEASIEFPDENLPKSDYRSIKQNIKTIINTINQLRHTYEKGKMIKEGINIPIVGRPNVGKSSLFNILVGNPLRAIVAPTAGTTRDFISEYSNVNGHIIKFTDTAGIKYPRGIIEKKSQDMTKISLENASLVILLFDGTRNLHTADLSIWKQIGTKPVIIAINKSDLKQKIMVENIKKTFHVENVVNISCKNSTGIEELKDHIDKKRQKICPDIMENELIITNSRHKQALDMAYSQLCDAAVSANNGLSEEFIISNLRQALSHLQEISGETWTEKILDSIFSQFCIGK